MLGQNHFAEISSSNTHCKPSPNTFPGERRMCSNQLVSNHKYGATHTAGWGPEGGGVEGFNQCWPVLKMNDRYLPVFNSGINTLTHQVSKYYKELALVYNHGSQKVKKKSKNRRFFGQFFCEICQFIKVLEITRTRSSLKIPKNPPQHWFLIPIKFD